MRRQIAGAVFDLWPDSGTQNHGPPERRRRPSLSTCRASSSHGGFSGGRGIRGGIDGFDLDPVARVLATVPRRSRVEATTGLQLAIAAVEVRTVPRGSHEREALVRVEFPEPHVVFTD